MATVTPQQRRLTNGLARLKVLQDEGGEVFRSKAFNKVELAALEDAGFLQRVLKGWYIASRPGGAPGETTPWHASMRAFLRGYCEERFGESWHVSPAYSVQLHAGSTSVPRQLVIHAPGADNHTLDLPAGCPLLLYKAKEWPNSDQTTRVEGVRALTLPAALVRVPENFFTTSATDAQIALGQVRDASGLSRLLLEGNNRTAAGRLAGAFRAIGRVDIAEELKAALRSIGHAVTEVNPFDIEVPVIRRPWPLSPYVDRMHIMWREMQPIVQRILPAPPGLPNDAAPYMRSMDAAYQADAYHSLSIEGYRVTTELIARVADGTWDPRQHAQDADAKNALAAHGYWRAFQSVKSSVERILAGEVAAGVVAKDHGAWYREMFAPSVAAGLLKPSDLAGYRNSPVYIKDANHVPPPSDAVRDMMPALFELLRGESHAGVRAVLGHFFFVFIHPYMDGNGRVGRFIMNSMFASGGHRWTIIRLDKRDDYMRALDAASSGGNIEPFSQFIASSIAAQSEKA